MAAIHQLRGFSDNIAIIGWSCRLPGANSVSDLWRLLAAGECAVSQVPEGRFPLAQFGHPRRRESGKTYTWAAGVLDDIWGFDPGVFGISPREAEQMDPQQRILLQLTWEALEDAGVPPSALAGKDVGVFIGASQTGYAHAIISDPAIADGYFATGNALAILANRVSYIFDFKGPSVTIDTACSSSLVALHQACEALRSGRIDTAIVGGINVIASSMEFISFSQASMLSPTGLCQAFSAHADGYVRSEGGAVLVLRRVSEATMVGASPVHGVILASDVNSDGRTNGISLPSSAGQAALLERVYAQASIDPNRLAFVEAHGTGTPVGDPIEAGALGRMLGVGRDRPLPIGSIKTNIGHTEAASGLAGLIKAVLSLQNGLFPRSLHSAELNPAIPFEDLNLSVCADPHTVVDTEGCCAGVNSFGFGGTNAHVVVAPAEDRRKPTGWQPAAGGNYFAFTAATKPALKVLAQQYAHRLEGASNLDTARLAAAIAHRRDRQASRAVIAAASAEQVREALDALISDQDHAMLMAGTAVSDALPVGFVYSGNGGQWVGMGKTAYRHNAGFRAQFDIVDGHFTKLAGWSLKDALFDDALGARIDQTSVAQPLIFAIQSAGTAALRACGLRPVATIGHSVGEVAAAEAAGALDTASAVEVIYHRSKHQELVRGAGRMAAVLSSLEEFEEALSDLPGIEVAAVNSSRAITVAGSTGAMAVLEREAARRGIAMLDLGLDYPFHTSAMAPAHGPLVADLSSIAPRDTDVAFISTVTGSVLPGSELGADYWWRNIREPVRFLDGIREMAESGIRFFVEIGPHATLLRHVTDNPAVEKEAVVTAALLDRNDPDRDPLPRVISKAFISGVELDRDRIFGPDPGPSVPLPSYPWQQQAFRFTGTQEATGSEENKAFPFSGVRRNGSELVWHTHIDTALFPRLGDHRVGEQTIFPGTGFLEIAFAVACEWLGTRRVLLTSFDILNPLDLTSGETREIMTRVSPAANMIEIFSRPRLSQSAWLQHCRAKMFHAEGDAPPVPPTGEGASQVFSADEVYRIAGACGLEYGPAFRLLTGAVQYPGGIIKADLAPDAQGERFMLDPVRLDACCHGLISIFPELRAEERGVSYLPVRLGEAALHLAEAFPHHALIEVLSRTERAITANYTILGPNGEVIAALRGVYCQAAQIKRPASLDNAGFVELPRLADGGILGKGGLAIGIDAILERARDKLPAEATSANDAGLLLEGCAVAAAHEIVGALADDGVLDIDACIASGRLSLEARPWFEAVLASAEQAGLAERSRDGWMVIDDPLLPSTASVVKELADAHPSCSGELMLAGVLAGLAMQAARDRALRLPVEPVLTPAVLDFHDLADETLRQAGAALMMLLADDHVWPKDRAIRILLLGHGPLTRPLMALQRLREVSITLIEPDRRRRDAARRAIPANSDILLEDDLKEDGEFDLVVTAGALSRLPFELDALARKLAPHGVLMAIEPGPTVFHNLMAGLVRDSASGETIVSPGTRLKTPQDWRTDLERTGFAKTRAYSVQAGSGLPTLILAEAPARETSTITVSEGAAVRRCAIMLADRTGPDLRIAVELANHLRRHGFDAKVSHSTRPTDRMPDMLIHFIGSHHANPDAAEALTACCLDVKTCVEAFDTASASIWHVTRGALPDEAAGVDPFASGLWSFSRTVANEFPALDMRRIDIAPHVSPANAAARICGIVLSQTTETELQVAEDALRAVRVDRIRRELDRGPQVPVSAVRLQRRFSAPQHMQWEASERVSPAASQVEIAVDATALNFRDLMWSLSLLSDDIIEEGIAGATFGCECAGRIVRVGSAVTDLKPGDRVIALAPSAFSTHVTVAADCVVKAPDGLASEAAATIPVAFLTVHYSLITQAQLKRGEWVLIHGGAGGVGMAAIQIARLCGARIIATAGSTAKRDLLSALGVDHVLDSRSNDFAEAVRAITASGVDVVLNSLAGEAMERGIGCLRPFGRFVEIGKRDYIANTHVGLGPFRKNLSYFGVDVDRLMLERPDIGREIFATLAKQFEDGELSPLPYTVFEADAIAEAFHLMQRSGHIGKLVVRAPKPELPARPGGPFVANAAGTHVITGGLGGFGWEAAQWLADHGARHLVLLGRRGPDEERKAAIAELSAQGVQIYVASCDVSDRRALERVFAHIARAMPPVVGVLHAAMVLDDGLLSNLDAERFRQVLAPKVTGADHLDRMTRGMTLDYFVLFSSATTLVGNPGQANYVAANAYMEGIARRRRQEGLKALAIGWGPITDVGVLARSERLRARFQKLIGIRGMRARDALDLMACALQQPQTANFAVMTISPVEGIFTADRLPVLRSPTYASMIRGDQDEFGHLARNVDLRALARSEGIEAVQQTLTDIIVGQLAHILHSHADDIPRTRPLAHIGVDSLMAIEVAMSLEEITGIHVSLTSTIGSLTVSGLAHELIAQLKLGERDDPMVKSLAAVHAVSLSDEQMAVLEGIAGDADEMDADDPLPCHSVDASVDAPANA